MLESFSEAEKSNYLKRESEQEKRLNEVEKLLTEQSKTISKQSEQIDKQNQLLEQINNKLPELPKQDETETEAEFKEPSTWVLALVIILGTAYTLAILYLVFVSNIVDYFAVMSLLVTTIPVALHDTYKGGRKSIRFKNMKENESTLYAAVMLFIGILIFFSFMPGDIEAVEFFRRILVYMVIFVITALFINKISFMTARKKRK